MPSFSSTIFNKYPVILFFLFSMLLCLSRAWEGVLDGDSMWYMILARGVVDSGDWGILSYRGREFFDHPPMGIWLIAILFKIFGTSVYVAKLMNALALFGSATLIYKIGKHLKDENVGIVAALIFLFTPQIIQMTGKIKLDMPLIFFSTLAMYGVILGATVSRWYYTIFGLGTAAALLTKGIVGVAPIPIAFFSLLILKRWRELFSTQFIIGLSLVILIPLPWVFWVLSKLGTAPFIIYWNDNIRYAAFFGRGEDTLPGFWYFAGILLTRGAPWTWVGLVTIFMLVRKWIKDGFDESIFLLFWVVIIYLGYSIPKFKYSYYISPIYPPFVILASISITKFISKDMILKYSYIACIVVAFALSVFPLPIRLDRSQGITSILPAVQKKYETNKNLKIATLDVHPTDENNTYQLIAMNIDPKIVVKPVSKNSWRSLLKKATEDDFNLVIIHKKSLVGFGNELASLKAIAFSNEYALYEKSAERR